MRVARRNLAKTGRGIVTRRLLREDSKKEPRNDGLRMIVTRRLLREDSKKEPRKDGKGDSDTEIAS
ncbi:MAG: hypothetical protein FWG98_14050 [Candidatus Cloacimonetes bacterium]|nr:hypothetical protein [Candidatus Cloacimonadota bacterium]